MLYDYTSKPLEQLSLSDEQNPKTNHPDHRRYAGIGRATALALANANSHLILLGRDEQALEAVDDGVRAAGGTATLIPHNLRNFVGIQEMAHGLAGRFDRLHALILNGGMLGRLQNVEDLDPKHFVETIETNLIANFMLLQSFTAMLRTAGGQVLALTTGAVPHPRAYWSSYAASKAGLEALIQSYAHEVAPTIRANLLDPGRVRTDMRATAYPGEDPMQVSPTEDIAKVIKQILNHPDRPTGQRYHAQDFSA